MTGDRDDGDDGFVGPSRRRLLQGIAVGAVGGAGAGIGWPHLRDLTDDDGQADDRPDTAEAVADLVATEDATHTATGGQWDDPEAWDSAVPGDHARVHVPAGTTVTLAHEATARLRTVRVDGTLRTDPETTSALAVGTLVVTGTGRLALGMPDAPDRDTTVTFLDRGPIDEDRDPTRVSRGLLALPGATVRMAGHERTSFRAVTDGLAAGSDQLTLAEAPTGWAPGDRVVVAGMSPDENEDEERTVAAIDGATVTLDRPLANDHRPPADDLSGYVAHRDRTVRLRSESERTKHRGHVMFMNRDVALQYTAFEELGRTDKSRPFTDPRNGVPPEDAAPNPQARYACHFHRTGVDTEQPPRRVTGCVVDGSPGWGFVNHSSYVAIADSLSYRVFGAGFVAESGTEVGSFERNFALRSQGSGELPDSRQFHADSPGDVDDFGHGGNGFWFQSPAVVVRDNVAAGHRHHGFVYWTRAKPDRSVDPDQIGGVVGELPTFPFENLEDQSYLRDADAATDGAVPPSYVALRSFRGNTVFASGGGLDVSRHRFGDDPPTDDTHSVIEEFTAFDVGSLRPPWGGLWTPRSAGAQGGNNGVSIRYSRFVELRNPRLVSGRGGEKGIGLNHNHAPSDVRLVGGEITGWTVGARAFHSGDAPVRETAFDNDVDVQLISGGTDHQWSIQRVPIEDATFADGGRASVALGTELDSDLYGLFTPEGVTRLDGQDLYLDAQHPDFVPIPTEADLGDAGEDALGDLSTATPAELVGKTNATLWEEYGLSVDGEPLPDDAGREPDVIGGAVAGAGASPDPSGLVESVTTATGSLVEHGDLAQGERVYVYDEVAFLTVPAQYAGRRYLRFEREDGYEDRRSFTYLTLSDPATVVVAYDAESTPGWLGDWTDTGDALGTTDGPLALYRKQVDAGTTVLGGTPTTNRMYAVLVESR